MTTLIDTDRYDESLALAYAAGWTDGLPHRPAHRPASASVCRGIRPLGIRTCRRDSATRRTRHGGRSWPPTR